MMCEVLLYLGELTSLWCIVELRLLAELEASGAYVHDFCRKDMSLIILLSTT